ncbi:hypothetical protein [Metallosphaera hakonensis]|uniref:Uncharacterized protein n=1 Tax=Metallosphaera hakonensis JCM 8857 = DSM 7519 TaxID=1293036 RepID=A0A2U9IT73_9CREN|nr:hypothetical protein [Metallosphaera hakonensis]AWR99162.1 hypothetical protein DFR87_04990 [Metallosphaera hakonensis JCM 8857 = DSM 7519]
MEHKIGINLTLFSLVYVIALFLELIFNREFLAGVIPIGMIANTPVVERAFSIMFVIGAVAFGMVLIMQPILLGSAAYIGKLNRPGKILLWTSLYLSILLDLVHVIYGVNNTSFDPPALFSLVYVLILISAMLFIITYLRKWILLLLLIPDFLAYGTLIGNWLIQIMNSSVFGSITAICGELMSYSVLVVGAGFLIYAIKRGISVKLMIPFVVLAIVVGTMVYTNAIPGLGIMIGVVFPYIFGILGVRNWMPPLIFAIGIMGLGSAFLLYKKDPALSLSCFTLLFGSLIFDSVSTTVYLLIPLTAVAIQPLFGTILEGQGLKGDR